MGGFFLKSKSTAALIPFLLIFTLLGQGMVSGIVLCMGGDDHMAIEPFHKSAHYSNVASKAGQHISHLGLDESPYSSCIDVPISTGFSRQSISTSHYLRSKIKTLALSTSNVEIILYKQDFYRKFLSKIIPPDISKCEVQNIILLI